MNTNKTFKRPVNTGKRVTVHDKVAKLPEHIANIVYILNNNAEIRRFTSLAMIKELAANNVVTDTDKVFIKFGLGKYSVCINGLNHEYTFENNLFVEAFDKAFKDFSNHGHKVLQAFIKETNKKSESDNTNSPVEGEKPSETPAE